MHSELTQKLLHELQQPDATSLLVPLVIILSLLITGLIAISALLVSKLRLLRWLRRRGGAREISPSPDSVVIYLERGGKFRRFFKRVLSFSPIPDSSGLEELEKLRQQVDGLGHALQAEREQHARALQRVTELRDRIQSLERLCRQESEKVAAEVQRRAKLQEKAEALEVQLQEAVQEVGRIYQGNAKLAESPELPREIAAAVARARRAPSSAPDPLPEGMSEHDREVQRLKQVLGACRDQMLRMTGGKPFQSRITPKK